ncbi:MAG: hypothetical protein IK092_02435, partial [Muribaculaceae bacterium]|nr:hypothetical protein [Muribaculaceae bacterium]
MKQGRKETITIRLVSTTFIVVALAVFKPFGLDMSQWQTYVHLFIIWVMGLGVCFISDFIMKYVLKKPNSYQQGVQYIIHRNMLFQLINTPLVSIMICLYRH